MIIVLLIVTMLRIVCQLAKTPFSKRVIKMTPTKVTLPQPQPPTHSPPASPSTASTPSTPSTQGWQFMQFDKLCSLPLSSLNMIQKQIKKTKVNTPQQYFTSNNTVTNPSAELPRYWVDVYQTLCNLRPVSLPKYEKWVRDGYHDKMLLDEPLQDEALLKVIKDFINNIVNVKKLENVAEPSFCKYLLALTRDLRMLGLNIENHVKQAKQIKLVGVLGYQYQFWVNVSHNRQKNNPPEQYILQLRTVPNPNTTVAITQQYPNLKITYISRKKKKQQTQMFFVIKMLIEIQVDGNRHVVKVQRKGPMAQGLQDRELRFGYFVTDFDGIYKGNPTIKPVFVF